MRAKHLIPFFMIFVLTGCSAFNFFFEHLPFFTKWQMNRMLDLSEVQEQMVEKGTEEVQQWFVEEAFPLWISRLEESHSLWTEGNHKDAALQFEKSVQTSLNEFLLAVQPRLLPLLLSLSDKNIRQYRKYNDDKKDDWFEYSLSDEHKQDARIEKLFDWFGPLRDSQTRAAKHIVKLFPNERKIRYANNDYWKEQLIAASLSRDSELLNTWLADPSIWWLPEYTQLRENNKEQRRELVEMMIESMSTKQAKRVADYVKDWIEKLSDVAS